MKPEKRPLSFGKEEKLKSRKFIEILFAKGKSITSHPIRLIYCKESTTQASPMVMFSVPKKHFKKAVDRNRIKRQMREIYRLNKNLYGLNDNPEATMIAFIYITPEKIPFKILEKKLNLALGRLTKTDK